MEPCGHPESDVLKKSHDILVYSHVFSDWVHSFILLILAEQLECARLWDTVRNKLVSLCPVELT